MSDEDFVALGFWTPTTRTSAQAELRTVVINGGGGEEIPTVDSSLNSTPLCSLDFLGQNRRVRRFFAEVESDEKGRQTSSPASSQSPRRSAYKVPGPKSYETPQMFRSNCKTPSPKRAVLRRATAEEIRLIQDLLARSSCDTPAHSDCRPASPQALPPFRPPCKEAIPNKRLDRQADRRRASCSPVILSPKRREIPAWQTIASPNHGGHSAEKMVQLYGRSRAVSPDPMPDEVEDDVICLAAIDLPPPEEWLYRPILLRRSARMLSSMSGARLNNTKPNKGFCDRAPLANVAGPSQSQLPINSKDAIIPFETLFFTGKFHMKIANLPSSPPEYFGGRARLQQVVVQGRFKRRLPLAAVVTGQRFDRPFALDGMAAWAVSALLPVLRRVMAGCRVDLLADAPYFESPLAAACQALAVHRPGEEPFFGDLAAAAGAGAAAEEATALLGGPFAGGRVPAARRKALLSDPAVVGSLAYDPALMYTFDVYQHQFDPAALRASAGPLGFDLGAYLAGQPLRMFGRVALAARHWEALAEEEEEEEEGGRGGAGAWGFGTAAAGCQEEEQRERAAGLGGGGLLRPRAAGLRRRGEYLWDFEVWHERLLLPPPPCGGASSEQQGGQEETPRRASAA